ERARNRLLRRPARHHRDEGALRGEVRATGRRRDPLAMGRHHLAALALLLLVAPAWAQHLPGEAPVTGIMLGGLPVCGAEGPLWLSPTDFNCICTANGNECSLLGDISHLGQCAGETSDWCHPVDFSGTTIKNAAFTAAATAGSVLSVDYTGTGTTS